MPRLRLEKREQSLSSMWLAVWIPVLACVLTLLFGLVLFIFLDQDPWDAFLIYFFRPIDSIYGVSELLLKASPLILIGVGLAIGFRANVWNIGAEGQFVIGAAAATGVALLPLESWPAWLVLTMMALAGILGGMAWASIKVFLKIRYHASEILVSLMLVYVAKLVISWLVHGPWQDPDGHGFPQTALFGGHALLGTFFDTRLTISIVLALLAVLIGYFYLFKTFSGFCLRVFGLARSASQYAGLSDNKAIWIGMLAGGGLAGLAGMTEVSGPLGQLTEHVASGYGFSAIIVAYVGRLHPVGIVFSALVMSLFYLGGEQVQQHLGLPLSISQVFQGVLLFFLLGCDVLIKYRFAWRSA